MSEQHNLHEGAKEGPEEFWDPPTHRVTQLKSGSFLKAEDSHSQGKTHSQHSLLSLFTDSP